MTEAGQCSPHLREMLIEKGGVPAADGGIRFPKEKFIGDPYSLFGLLRDVDEDLAIKGIEKAVRRRYERWTQERAVADAHPSFTANTDWLIINEPIAIHDVPEPLLDIGAEERPDGRVQIPRDGFLRAGLSVEIVAEMMGIEGPDERMSPS